MVTAKKTGLEPEVWWAAMKGGAADSFVLQHDVPSICKLIEEDAGIELRVAGNWIAPWEEKHADEKS